MKHRFQHFSFGLGLLLLTYLLWKAGWSTLASDFRKMGASLILLLLLSGAKYVIRSLSWAAAFFPEERQSWRELFRYRLSGDALNYLSIAGPLLGEPVKAALVPGVHFSSGLGSTLLETMLNGIAAVLLTAAGLALIASGNIPGDTLRHITVPVIAVLLLIAFGFPYVLKRKVPILTWPWKRIRRIPWLRSQKVGANLVLLEARMQRLSAERPGALWWIFLLGFATQALALLEIYLVVAPLGITPRLSALLMMEAFTKLVKAVFFFVPARIGADEGSTAGIFLLLGLAPSAGVTLALARRLRAIFWSAIGVAFLLPVRARLRSAVSKPAVRVTG